jgi:hypothetical protein
LRKLAWCVCTILLFAGFVRAQQIDLAVGASSLFSSKSISTSQAFLPPPEKGGMYPGASVNILFRKHLGVNAEGAFRYREGLYNGYQRFRPVIYDVNALFVSRLSDKSGLDLLAGIGGQSLIFYNKFGTCNYSSCPITVSSTQLMGHIGAGVRYYFLGNFFARPELHYYFVKNNIEFHSNNVFRAGVSIGYSFHR